MAKLSVVPRSVNPAPSSVPLLIRQQVNAQAICPWCGARMYLNPAGNRLLCADNIHCAGVLNADPLLQEICQQHLKTGKEVA